MGFARKTGAQSLPEVFRRLLGAWCGNAVSVLYGLLMAFTAAMMLRTCAELGALALPVKNGRLWGLIAAVFMSVTVLAGRQRLLPGLGAAAVVAAVLFYGALMLDTRPVRVNMRYETVLNLSGSLWAASVLALLHACLNSSVAGGTAAAFAGGSFDADKAAFLAGGMMIVLLFAALHLAHRKPPRPWHCLALALVCGLFWEYITPLYLPRSVSDPWDILAVLLGGMGILPILYRLEK